MNGKLAEQVQSLPPTLSQSKFLCHTLHMFAPIALRRPPYPILFDFQLSPQTVILLNLLWILVDLMDVVQFPLCPSKMGWGKMYYNHGTAE